MVDVTTQYIFKLKSGEREFSFTVPGTSEENAARALKNELHDVQQQLDTQYPGQG